MSNTITRRGFFQSLAAGAVGVAIPDKATKTVEYERLGDYAVLTVWGGGNVTLPADAFPEASEINMYGGTVNFA